MDKYDRLPSRTERNKELYLSSAWFKHDWSWEKVKAFFESMTDGKSYFLCSLPYQLAIKEGLLMREQVEDEMSESDFDEISCWQAFKAADKPNFDFSTNSAVRISADANNTLGIGETAYNGNAIVGIIYDHRAMGICPHKVKVTTNYTAIADFWNEYYHQLVNYIIDSNFNMVALILD